MPYKTTTINEWESIGYLNYPKVYKKYFKIFKKQLNRDEWKTTCGHFGLLFVMCGSTTNINTTKRNRWGDAMRFETCRDDASLKAQRIAGYGRGKWFLFSRTIYLSLYSHMTGKGHVQKIEKSQPFHFALQINCPMVFPESRKFRALLKW